MTATCTWHTTCFTFRSMLLYRSWLAISVVLILAGTAWIAAGQNADPYFAYSLIALLAFGLDLADGSTMGFVFVILALPHLPWRETLLLAESATFIHAVTHPDRVEPRTLLRSMCSTALAVLATQFMFHSPLLARIDGPVRLMMGSGVCFVALHALKWKRGNLWSFPYYPVAAAIAALFPISVVLAPLLYLTWWTYRLYERRLVEQQSQWKKAASLNLRTIETLALAIEAKDQPMTGHSRRVQIYATEMAKELGLPPHEVEALRTASLLYDIGELAVPEHIILKPGPLTPEEFEKVKIHPAVAAEILERVKFPYPVAPIVLAHHERWDGTGYPHGLKGTEIPIGARILSAVDAVDAYASPRRHRAAIDVREALERVAAESGRAYDPRVIAILRKKQKQWERLVAAAPGPRLHRLDFLGPARSECAVRPDAPAGKLARSERDVRHAEAGAATACADGFVRRVGGARWQIGRGIYWRQTHRYVHRAADSDGARVVGMGGGESAVDHQRRGVLRTRAFGDGSVHDNGPPRVIGPSGRCWNARRVDTLPGTRSAVHNRRCAHRCRPSRRSFRARSRTGCGSCARPMRRLPTR